jgi:hypothetical protein
MKITSHRVDAPSVVAPLLPPVTNAVDVAIAHEPRVDAFAPTSSPSVRLAAPAAVELRVDIAALAIDVARISGMPVDLSQLSIDVLSEQEMEDAIAKDTDLRAGQPCPRARGVKASYLPSERRVVLSAPIVAAMSAESLRVVLGHELTHVAQHQTHPQLFARIEELQKPMLQNTATPEEKTEVFAACSLQEGHAIYTQTKMIEENPRATSLVMSTGEQMIEVAAGERQGCLDPKVLSVLGYLLVKRAMESDDAPTAVAAMYDLKSYALFDQFQDFADRWQKVISELDYE